MTKLIYQVSLWNKAQQLIKVEVQFQSENDETTFRLPLWRPGRYEAQQYAKNIINFSVENHSKTVLKTTPNSWQIAAESGQFQFSYLFFCNRLNAGGCWVEEDLLYLNLINCLMLPNGDTVSNIEVKFKGFEGSEFKSTNPEHFDANTNSFFFKNEHELFDTALFVSPNLKTISLDIKNTKFEMVFYAQTPIEDFGNRITNDFEKFIAVHEAVFDGFPFKHYTFLFFMLPNRFYHGVEHLNGTVITIGSIEDALHGNMYNDLLGISCHELFHAWNVCRIRPKALSPYDFFEPKLFSEGVFLEGFTTYMGDYLLFDAGVLNLEEYLFELNQILARHLANPANEYSSLIDSSIDLWVDGYSPTHPLRKVSIYDKGCMASLILDDMIRTATSNAQTLKDFFRFMWQKYPLKGLPYSLESVIGDLDDLYGIGKKWLDSCLTSKDFLLDGLSTLQHFPFKLKDSENETKNEIDFGFSLQNLNGVLFVEKVDFKHPNAHVLRANDMILEVNGKLVTESSFNQSHHANIEARISRNGKQQTVFLTQKSSTFFKKYRFVRKEDEV